MCQSMMLKDNGKYCSVFPLFKYILEFENLGRIVFQKQKKKVASSSSVAESGVLVKLNDALT